MKRDFASTTVLLMLACVTGCSILPQIFGTQRAAAERARELQDLQSRVMRFADEYVGRMIAPLSAFQASNSTPAARLAAQSWKVSQATSAYTIASGPNAYGNALDFVVLATLSRMVVEDQWLGGEPGDSARALYDVHRQLEELSWELVANVLDPQQREQLRALIDDWRARNPKLQAVSYIHFADFARSVEIPGRTLDTSLLALVGLDPLSNLDPALHEIAQTRQLAERAIYYVQRSPNLLDMQVERLAYQLAVMPETRQVLVDVQRTSYAAEKAGELAGALRLVVAPEREAAIEKFVTGLSEQERQIRALTEELRQTLQAGAVTSDSLNATIQSLDALIARFKPAANEPAQPEHGDKPFDIEQYTVAAREIANTTRELQGLIRALNAGAPGVVTVTENAFSNAKALISYAFWHIALLLVLLVALLFAAIAAYRALPALRTGRSVGSGNSHEGRP